MDNKRLEVLLDLYLDEGLDRETKQELEQLLLSSPHAREIFWEKANLNSMLRQLGQESWGHEEAWVERSKTPETPLSTFAFQRGWMLAASCLLAVGLVWWAFSVTSQNGNQKIASGETQSKSEPNGGQSDLAPSKQTTWVAIVRTIVDAEWARGERPLNKGEAMAARRIRLESGLVEIQTIRGALLTLQGPADLKIVSDMEVHCISGRLRVDVPPSAIGFQVNTPHIDVVDLGTSFAVHVDTEKETEVHVLEGKVELVSESANIPMQEVVEGQAVEVTDGVLREIASTESSMPSASQVDAKARIANQRLLKAFRRRRDAIANDPSCFVYFDFENASPQDLTLANKASGERPDGNGTIVGCEWVQGRWPGKKALDFKSTFDRVLLEAPGEHEALTCLASVRLDSMDSSALALLMPAFAFDRSISWQISAAATAGSQPRLQFGRCVSNGWNLAQQFSGSLGFRREQLRTWAQLAVVWDGVDRVCSQYVDGVLVSRDSIQSSSDSNPMLLRTGKLVVGNSTLDDFDRFTPLSHFVGRMDELAMFNRALGEDEIVAFHNLNNVSWSNANKDGDWNEPDNWPARIEPEVSDAVYIDRSGEDAAIYADGVSPNLNEIRVGSMEGLHGELKITGGTLTATKSSDANSRIGVAGGHGTVVQEDGVVTLNSLQVGLDEMSRGFYGLEGGSLLIARGIQASIGSLDIGAVRGVGSFEVKGGALTTRIGVSLGRNGGRGQFSVYQSGSRKISIGSHGSGDGFWVQHSGSTLRALVDAKGLTPIVIHDVDKDMAGGEHCSVSFASGSLLEIDFIDEPRSGEWDVMKWQGELIDQGLVFSPDVDTDIWGFRFVDTNASGALDTLRVTANVSATGSN